MGGVVRYSTPCPQVMVRSEEASQRAGRRLPVLPAALTLRKEGVGGCERRYIGGVPPLLAGEGSGVFMMPGPAWRCRRAGG